MFSNEFKDNFVEFARYSSMEISTFPWIKGFEIFPYVRMYDRAKDNKDCKDCEHFQINKIISI